MNRLVLVMLMLCSSIQCSSPLHDVNGDFHRLADSYIEGYLAWRPQEGSALGYHTYDGKISNFSSASIDSEHARLERFVSELSRLDTTRMDPGVYYDLQILHTAINGQLFACETMDQFRKNPMTYLGPVDINMYLKRNYAPLADRVRSIISVERQIPDLFEAARQNLHDSLPRPYCELAIQMARGLSKFLAKDLPVALASLGNDSLMQELHTTNDRAIKEFDSYADYIEKTKLPRSNNNYALGVRNYQRMLTGSELITQTPDEILQIGMQTLREEQKRFADAAKIIDPSRTPAEVFKEIQRDHPKADSLIADTRKNLETIRQFTIDHDIISMPSDVRAIVKETPPYLRATTFASMDSPGPFETKATEAYYYVTPVNSDWTKKQKDEWLSSFNYYTMDAVSIHEAYPGHYTQFLHLNASKATRLEKIFGSYAFIEGWAHYTEQMMLAQGFGDNGDVVRTAKFRMAQSSEALLRLCRLCVSIRMHCNGMSLEEATAFFEDNCHYEHTPAYQEAIRGTFDPGYLFYAVGKLEFLKLREDYHRQVGASFSLHAFHDLVLSMGMPPIRLLRERLLNDRALDDQIF
jgi:uncharacterized protein (DUF885 family)